MPIAQTLEQPVGKDRHAFRLLRYFSTTSLIGLAVVLAGLLWIYHHLVIGHMVDHEHRANVNLTTTFANTIWSRFGPFITHSRGKTAEDLRNAPEIESLRAEVIAKMKDTPVLKVKVYNPDGMTVFSTEQAQIGEIDSDDTGVRLAIAGKPVSEISYRDSFSAIEGKIAKRDLITSYVPYRIKEGSDVVAVFEVYSDVTALLADVNRTQWQVAGGVGVSLALLYGFLYLIVRRADAVIRDKERQQVAQEERVRHQAYHDTLTGLPNRRNFTERLEESLKLARRMNHPLGLMFIDLDRFKVVNDSLGHQAGDQLLKTVSQRLLACVRESDLVFRMGGDEFTVILESLEHPEEAAVAARRIIGALTQPMLIFGQEITVGTSIGITVFPADGQSPEELVRNADAAMYSAKAAGRGCFAFFTAEMKVHSDQRLAMEMALQRAAREGEFVIHYQPRVTVPDRQIVAAEALLRWRHPQRGLLRPAEFLDVLEDSGLIVQVGGWVIAEASRQARRWADAGSPIRVSVNISPQQFRHEQFVQTVAQALADSGLPPALLELELTEALLVENPEHARHILDQLKAMGLAISIDDFGSGYSSLNYLRQFPVEYLKIDRSFVSDILTNERDAAIAKAIAGLAETLGIRVVAAGVEQEGQAAFLGGQYCTEMQGFLFGEAQPAEQIARLFAAPRLATTAS